MDRETTGTNHTSHGGRKRAWVYLAATAVMLSAFATSIVLGNVAAGAPRQLDENASAHVFQLAMAAQPPLLLLFLAFADWTQEKRIALLLGSQIIAAGVALGALAWSGY